MGTDNDPVHVLVQSVPSYRPPTIVQIIKRLTAREIFPRVPTVKKRLWGGAFWSTGYGMSTGGRHGNAAVMRAYVRQQGSEKASTPLHRQDVQVGVFYAVHAAPSIAPPNWRARATRQRGFDTSQLAAG